MGNLKPVHRLSPTFHTVWLALGMVLLVLRSTSVQGTQIVSLSILERFALVCLAYYGIG